MGIIIHLLSTMDIPVRLTVGIFLVLSSENGILERFGSKFPPPLVDGMVFFSFGDGRCCLSSFCLAFSFSFGGGGGRNRRKTKGFEVSRVFFFPGIWRNPPDIYIYICWFRCVVFFNFL